MNNSQNTKRKEFMDWEETIEDKINQKYKQIELLVLEIEHLQKMLKTSKLQRLIR